VTILQYLVARRDFECSYADRSIKSPGLNNIQLLHYGLGLATEGCELAAAAKAGNNVNIVEELGDICWFAAGACQVLDVVPDETYVAAAPKVGIYEVISRCEEFASRIKAAIYYGSPAKPKDPSEDYWTTLPAQILVRAMAIAQAQANLGPGGLLAANIRKLKARFPDKFDAGRALNRNTSAELALMMSGAGVSLTSSDLKPVAKAPVKAAAVESADMPNKIIKPHAPDPGVTSFKVNLKEIKEQVSSTQRPVSLSSLLGKQKNQGHEDGYISTGKPADDGQAPASAADQSHD